MLNNIDNFTIKENAPILSGLKKINRNANNILFTVNKKNQISGTITDGDIRRALLKGITLNDSVIKIANKKFKFVYDYQSSADIIELMEKHKIHYIPVLNKKKELINIFRYDDFIKSYINVPVLIFAGGKGERLKPLTSSIPKPLLNLGSKSIIELIIEKLISEGFFKIFISLNYKSQMIKNKLLKRFPDRLNNNSFIIEKMPLGTAGSVLKLRKYNFKDIITYNSDIMCDINLKMLIREHKKNRNTITSVIVPFEYSIPYGIADIKGKKIKKIIEKPKELKYVLSGINIINTEIFSHYKRTIRLDMNMLILNAIKDKYKVSYSIHKGLWTDMGELDTYKKLKKIYGSE